MIPASIIYPELLACAVAAGDFYDDGEPRSRGFPWEPETPVQTQAEIDHEAYKADQRERHAARTGTDKRSYGLRFATPQALENHRANSRRSDKIRRDKATLKRKAERVNREDFSISPTPQADRDRVACITGASNIFRTAA